MSLLKRIECRGPPVSADATMAVDGTVRVAVRLGSQSDLFLCQKETNVLNGVTSLTLEVTTPAPRSLTICTSFDVRQRCFPRRVVRIRALPDDMTFCVRHISTEA